MAEDVDRAGRTGYTHDELALLYEIAESHGISGEHIAAMIAEEMAYHDMGRRRGLFPSLHQIIVEMAEGR